MSRTVGVIGGMGPEATVDFLRRIVAATPAKDDADHIRVLVDNNPKIPSRIAALIDGTGEDPLPVLIAMARGLEKQGADFLVIPCNTAHYYLPKIAQAVSIPLLDMVALAIAKIATLSPKPCRIGMLASPAVQKVGLYATRLNDAGFTALFSNATGEAKVLDIIRAVKGHNTRATLQHSGPLFRHRAWFRREQGRRCPSHRLHRTLRDRCAGRRFAAPYRCVGCACGCHNKNSERLIFLPAVAGEVDVDKIDHARGVGW